jgi:hypothetical protein
VAAVGFRVGEFRTPDKRECAKLWGGHAERSCGV